MGKNILIEDFERLSLLDKIYLQEDEDKMLRDAQYLEFLSNHEGKVIVEEDEETGKERKTVIINSSLLPF